MIRRYLLCLFLAVFVSSLPASASTAYLADWCFNQNGVNVEKGICNQFPEVSNSILNASTFDTTLEPASNNLGSISFQVAPGQYVAAYMDYDLGYSVYNVYSDFGTVLGTSPANVSYELDNPDASNIFNDFATNALNNQNNVAHPSGPPTYCCDVSWALSVKNDSSTTDLVTFTVSDIAPASGFYLEQTNVTPNQSIGASIYLSESSTPVVPDNSPVPENSTGCLLLTGVAALALGIFGARRLRPSTQAY
ncbi:MAG: hypothetical protein WB424_07665 [Terracidiphilus sp.]